MIYHAYNIKGHQIRSNCQRQCQQQMSENYIIVFDAKQKQSSTNKFHQES